MVITKEQFFEDNKTDNSFEYTEVIEFQNKTKLMFINEGKRFKKLRYFERTNDKLNIIDAKLFKIELWRLSTESKLIKTKKTWVYEHYKMTEEIDYITQNTEYERIDL